MVGSITTGRTPIDKMYLLEKAPSKHIMGPPAVGSDATMVKNVTSYDKGWNDCCDAWINAIKEASTLATESLLEACVMTGLDSVAGKNDLYSIGMYNAYRWLLNIAQGRTDSGGYKDPMEAVEGGNDGDPETIQ